MRSVIGSKWFFAGSIAVVAFGVVLLLAGCQMGVDKNGPSLALGTAAEKVADAGKVVAEVGAATGNPFATTLGGILSIVGTLGAGLFGAKKIAESKVKAHDEAPFTAEDAASIEAAKAKA